MIKKILLASAISMAMSSAMAQQTAVTIYGILDVGLAQANKTGSANDRGTYMISGTDSTSRIGFRAEENLGGGFKTGTQLESQIDMANGSQGLSSGSGSANATFSRGANVFLEEAKLGRMTVGRQANAAWSTYSNLDGRKNSNFGSWTTFLSDGSSFGGTPTAKTGISSFTGSSFTSNTLRYDTPKWSGFDATYARVFGNASGSTDRAKTDQYIMRYDTNSMIYGALGYYTANNASGIKSGQNYFAGVGARAAKDLTLTSAYFKLENPNGNGAINTEFDLYAVGGRYQFNPKVEITTSYYELKDKITSTNGAKMFSTGVTYEFSRRTQVYVMAASVNNRGTTGISVIGGGGANYDSLGQTANKLGAQGADQTAYAIGIRHSF